MTVITGTDNRDVVIKPDDDVSFVNLLGGDDFLFIDGDHSYEGLQGDWEAWRSLIAPGGIVALHDTRGGRFGCQRYMEEVILPDPEFSIVDEVESLTVLKRTDR